MRGSLRPGGQLRTDPAHVRFGPLKRGSCRYALPVSLLSSSAAEVAASASCAAALGCTWSSSRAARSRWCSRRRARRSSRRRCSSPPSGSSLAIPVSAHPRPTFLARANSLHVGASRRRAARSRRCRSSRRRAQWVRLPGRRAGGPRLGWVETTSASAAELVVTGGGGGTRRRHRSAEAEAEAEEDRAIGATQLDRPRRGQGLPSLIEVYEVRRVSAQVARWRRRCGWWRRSASLGSCGRHRVGEFFLWEHRDFDLARAHTDAKTSPPGPPPNQPTNHTIYGNREGAQGVVWPSRRVVREVKLEPSPLSLISM